MLLILLRDFCACDLAALGATCRRFSTPSLDCASVPEAAARLRCQQAGWPQRRVCATWVCALRLTECEITLPDGSRNIGHSWFRQKKSKRVPKLKQAEPAEGSAPPSPGARCSACGLPGSSWLNLTSGAVLCGRRQFDGSGGNACALKHAAAEATRGSPAPLAVKLGTVTADLRAGELRADVFSYAVRGAERDARLAQHLAHWGIDASCWALPKSMSMVELKVDQDLRFEAAIASWFAKPLEEVPELLKSFSFAHLDSLRRHFAHASRLAFAAQRAAAVRLLAGAEAPMPPLAPLPMPQALVHGQTLSVAALAAQMAALTAEEAEFEAESEMWDAAVQAASAAAAESAEDDD